MSILDTFGLKRTILMVVQVAEGETKLTIPYLEQAVSQLQTHQKEIQAVHSAQTRLF